MATLKIFNTLGYQVDPPTETEIEADSTLAPLIKDSIQFYIDRDANRVVCYFRAKSDVGSSLRPDHFFADFHGDTSQTLLTDFHSEMEHLSGTNEPESDWEAEWQFLEDMDEFNLPWLLSKVGDRNLIDLGLNPGEQLVIKNLVEDGRQLEIGLIDYEAVAVTIEYLRAQVDSDFSLAVSKNGRVSSVGDVDIVLSAGYDANFTPLSEVTTRKLRERRDSQEEDIRDWYSETAERTLDNIAKESEDIFEEYRTLSTIQHAIEAEAQGKLDNESAETLYDLVISLETNSPTSEGYDPRILADQTQTNLAREIRDQIATELSKLTENAFDQTKSLLIEHIEEVRAEQRPTQYAALNAICRVMDPQMSPIDDVDHPIVERFSHFNATLEDTDMLSEHDRQQLREEVLDELSEAILDCINAERNALKSRFEQAIDEMGNRSNKEKNTILQQIRTWLEDDFSDEYPQQELPEAFEDVLTDLEDNPVLPREAQESLHKDFLEIIEERKKALVEEQTERHRRRLQGCIESLREDTSNLEEEYLALSAAIKLASVGKIEGTPNTSGDGVDVGRFERAINSLENDSLLSRIKTRRIRREIRDELETAIDDVCAEKRRQIVGIIEDQLSNIIYRTQTEGYEETLDILNALRKYAQGNEKALNRMDTTIGQSTSEFAQQLDPIISGTSQSSIVLDQEACQEIRQELRERISDAKKTVRTERKAELEQAFERTLSKAMDDERLTTASRVVLLKRLLTDIGAGSGNNDLFGTIVEREGEESLRVFKKRYNNIQPILETVGEGDGVLTPQDQRVLRSAFTERLQEELEQQQDALIDSLVERIGETIETEYYQPDQKSTASPDALDTAISEIEEVRTVLSRPLNSQEKVHAYELDADQRDKLRLLDQEHRQSVKEKLNERLGRRIETLSEQLSEQVRELYEAEIRSIDESRRSPEEKLAAYSAVEKVLLGVPFDDDGNLQHDTQLRSYRDTLTSDDRDAIKRKISNRRDRTVSKLQEQLVKQTLNAVDAYCQQSRHHTQEGLKSFASYLAGNKFNPGENHLQKACETVNRARRLNDRGILSPKELQDVVSELQSEVSDRRDETKHNQRFFEKARRATLGRIRRSRGSPDTTTRNRTILAIGIIALIVLGALIVPSLGLSEMGLAGQPTSGDISQIQIENSGTEGSLRITGALSRSISEVDVGVVGPGVTTHQTIDVTDGTFALEIENGTSGSYEIALRPTGSDADWTNVTTHVSRGASDVTITSVRPAWGDTVNRTFDIFAETNSDRYTLIVYDSSGTVVHESTDTVRSETINETVSVDADGRYVVQLSASGQNTTTVSRQVSVEANETNIS